MSRKRKARVPGAVLILLSCVAAGLSAQTAPEPFAAPAPIDLPAEPPIPVPTEPAAVDAAPAPEHLRSGREIYDRFRAGLADPTCDADAGKRWQRQFRHAPGQLIEPDDDLLPIFGYVVDALYEAGLPTEFALIPFVESGYKPGARSASGPAGLWQFIGSTARNHGVGMRGGYDGRLSPVESTQAAVRYLKTLYGMFGGDWRLAVMAYNAGEYRVLQSLRRAGMNARNAQPSALPGLSPVTHAYVDKLHALACLFEQADDRDEWLRTLDRPVPRLVATALPGDATSLDAWSRRQGHDPALLRRLNPALAGGISAGGKPLRILAPAAAGDAVAAAVASASPLPAAGDGDIPAASTATADTGAPNGADKPKKAIARRSHVVKRGESPWSIARRYGLSVAQLQAFNHLDGGSALRPGMVLQLEEEPIR
ncbi:MAG: transglycosylase SLT domain-containing protein [Pseudoxanthomonas sp.]